MVDRRECDVDVLSACETPTLWGLSSWLLMERFSLWLARLILVMHDYMRAIPATGITTTGIGFCLLLCLLLCLSKACALGTPQLWLLLCFADMHVDMHMAECPMHCCRRSPT